MLLDERGNRKFELAPGQQKSLHTEHTILVPGPPEEIDAVRRVYELFVDQKKSLNEVVRILNSQGMPNANGRTWTYPTVRDLLANEKYIGNSVYNRTSRKLGTKMRRNSKSDWVRKIGAFEPIVSPERFAEAQRQLHENARPYTDHEMLDFLTVLWCREKHLSVELVEASEVGPSATAYKNHFGSLGNACRKVGFTSARTANRDSLLNIRRSIRREIESRIPEVGGTVEGSPGWNCQLRVNGELDVTVIIGRAAAANTARRQNEWKFEYRSWRKPDILIVARVDRGMLIVRDYYVFPYMLLPAGTTLTVSGLNYQRLEGFRSNSLEPFFGLCARQPLDALHT